MDSVGHRWNNERFRRKYRRRSLAQVGSSKQLKFIGQVRPASHLHAHVCASYQWVYDEG